MRNRHQRRQEQRTIRRAREPEEPKPAFWTRRKFLVAGLTALVAGTAYCVHEQTRFPTYAEALTDPRKRQAYAESLLEEKPEYVADIQYMPHDLLQKIQNLGYKLMPEGLAMTIPQEYLPFRIGTKSIIILRDTGFDESHQRKPEIWPDQHLILKNIIQNHERLHAEHNYKGMLQYQSSRFQSQQGKFNRNLFLMVSELLGHQAEYQGLLKVKDQATSPYLSLYLGDIAGFMRPYYDALSDPKVTKEMDPAFIQRLRQELRPSVLLK